MFDIHYCETYIMRHETIFFFDSDSRALRTILQLLPDMIFVKTFTLADFGLFIFYPKARNWLESLISSRLSLKFLMHRGI